MAFEKEFFLKYKKGSLSKARALRRNMTAAERKLWSLLKNNQLGVRFRRQVPIGPYIADFLTLKPKLVVELDGGQHYQKTGATHDSKRDAFLRKQGLDVLRFSNRDVLTNPAGVWQVIDDFICKRT